jgi:hypothetical protein
MCVERLPPGSVENVAGQPGTGPTGPVPTPAQQQQGGANQACTGSTSAQQVVVSGQSNPAMVLKLAQLEYLYAVAGLVIGAAAFGTGAAMIVFTNNTGAVDLKLSIGPAHVHIVTVVIGVVIALFGVLIIQMTRPSVKVNEKGDGVKARKTKPRPNKNSE